MITKQVFDYCRTHTQEIAAASPKGHETYSHQVYAVWEDGDGVVQARQRDASAWGGPSFIGFKNCSTAADVLTHVAYVEQDEEQD